MIIQISKAWTTKESSALPILRISDIYASKEGFKPMSKITTLKESELEETFSRASGPGGQNVNKVATRVMLRHIPTNTTVTVQDSRSQSMNRKLARERLLEALQNRERKVISEAKQRTAKIKRQNAKRPAAVKQRILNSKHHRSKIKRDRSRTSD